MKISTLAKRTALIVGLAAAGLSQAQDIKLGFNGDLSASPSAQSGKAGVIGIQAAIDDINASGGVLGKKLTLVIRDDQSQPPKSIQNMSDLIDNEKVAAVFGPTNSGNALAWKHIPNQKKVVSMGMIGSGTDITKPTAAGADNYMFRISMVDREQVAGLVAYAAKAGNKKIGLMGETTGYGQGGLKDLEEIAKLHGITPLATEKFGVADTDMTSQLNKMKSAGVETIMVWVKVDHASTGVPLPYGIDITPDGKAWVARLHTDEIASVDPDSGTVTMVKTPFKGPRRLRTDRDGNLWIVAFNESQIARYNPKLQAFTRFDLPLLPKGSDTPYSLNVDVARHQVWVNGTNSDSVYRLDIGSNTWMQYPMQRRVTFTRDVEISPKGQIYLTSASFPSWHIEDAQPTLMELTPR